jgi:hypothetical protein
MWLYAAPRLEGREAAAAGAERDDSFGLRAGVGDALAASRGLTGAERPNRRGLAGGALLWRRGLDLGLEERVTGRAADL